MKKYSYLVENKLLNVYFTDYHNRSLLIVDFVSVHLYTIQINIDHKGVL